MFAELTLALGIRADLAKSVGSETKKEIARVCRGKFDRPGGVESEDEMIFRLIIEEIQKRL